MGIYCYIVVVCVCACEFACVCSCVCLSISRIKDSLCVCQCACVYVCVCMVCVCVCVCTALKKQATVVKYHVRFSFGLQSNWNVKYSVAYQAICISFLLSLLHCIFSLLSCRIHTCSQCLQRFFHYYAKFAKRFASERATSKNPKVIQSFSLVCLCWFSFSFLLSFTFTFLLLLLFLRLFSASCYFSPLTYFIQIAKRLTHARTEISIRTPTAAAVATTINNCCLSSLWTFHLHG